MEIYKEKFPTIPPAEVIDDPNAAHNQTVAHKIASSFPKVRGEIENSTDPNEVRTIPLRPGPLPPQLAPFPKFLWHSVKEPMVVEDEEAMQKAIKAGYFTEKQPDKGLSDKDMLKAKIKQAKAELKQLEDNLAAAEAKG